MSFKDSLPKDISQLTIEELNTLSDRIAVFMAEQTPYPIETIVENLNVLELNLALHYVFDFKKDSIIFDSQNQGLVHKILTGRSDEVLLRSNVSLNLDADNPYDTYLGGSTGESLGFATAYAMETDKATVVVVDDRILNHGQTYEALVQISRNKPKVIIVLIDVQESLLRHHSSLDNLVKSVRISKTYVNLKKDMKSVLNSNAISRPVFNTLVKVRDALKETVLEPTVFTQFGIDYQGPINGQNIQDLIKVLSLSKNAKGPMLIHVQTRLKNTKTRKLNFPAFKKNQEFPDSYRNYHEQFDKILVGMRDPKLIIFDDSEYESNTFKEFAHAYPHNYQRFYGGTDNMISIAAGYASQGFKIVLCVSASTIPNVLQTLYNQFKVPQKNIVVLVRESGLDQEGNPFKQGIFDYARLQVVGKVYMGRNLMQTANILESCLEKEGRHFIRYHNATEERVAIHEDLKPWITLCPITEETKGLIITLGPAAQQFKTKIENNSLNIALVQVTQSRSVDIAVLVQCSQMNIPVTIYNVEDYENALEVDILRVVQTQAIKLKINVIDLKNSAFGYSSKELKRTQGIQIDDVIKTII